MADMKKVDMAEAAERLLAATDWLPALLRTAKPQEQAGAQIDVLGGDGIQRLPSELQAGAARAAPVNYQEKCHRLPYQARGGFTAVICYFTTHSHEFKSSFP
jgi:hypothetical protein